MDVVWVAACSFFRDGLGARGGVGVGASLKRGLRVNAGRGDVRTFE